MKLVEHVKYSYKKALRLYPRCAILRIRYAFFLLEYMENIRAALRQFSKAESMDLAMDEDFVIYRYKRILQEGQSDGSYKGGSAGMDLVSMIAYDNYFRQCKKNLERAAHLHMEFWAKLNVQAPDVGKLMKIGAKINVTINEVESYWTQMQKINPFMPQAVKMYAFFLKEILNDPDSAHDLLKTIGEYRVKKGPDFIRNDGDDENDEFQAESYILNTYSRDGMPCVCVSGETGNMGKIQGANKAFARMFGYSVETLQESNVKILIPTFLHEQHDKILRHAVESPEDVKYLGKERWLPARHRNGYIFMVYTTMRALPTFANKMNFVSTFKMDRVSETKAICYVLLDLEGNITSVSESKSGPTTRLEAITYLNLSLQMIREECPNVADCFPDMELGNLHLYTGEGKLVRYIRPKELVYESTL